MAGEGGWVRFGRGATWFEVWEMSAEAPFATGLAAFLDGAGHPVRPAGWPYSENDILSYSWQGDWLLAAEALAGSHPCLYQAGRLEWSSDTAQAVTFWPGP